MLGECKLCKQQITLIRAHLIPDGFKKFALSEGSTSLVLIDGNSGWHKTTQTLEYDCEILCGECDSLIGEFEDTFQTFIDEFLKHPDRKNSGNQKIFIPCDGDRIIIAILSILLKYSFSNRYPKIRLGQKYEDLISNSVKTGTLPPEYGKEFQIVAMGSNSYTVYQDGNEIDLSRMGRAQVIGGRSGGHHIYFMEPPGTWFAIKVGQAAWHAIASDEAIPRGSKFISVNTAPFDKSILHKDMLSGAAKRFQWIEERRKERQSRHKKITSTNEKKSSR